MPKRVTDHEYAALAEVRYRIRCFLNFSEGASRDVGLDPQQHQLLLAIRGLPTEKTPSIRVLAERLQIRHNSAVELVDRSVKKGLVAKRPGTRDKREVLLGITPRGGRVLEKLAMAHRTELGAMAPVLVEALTRLSSLSKIEARA